VKEGGHRAALSVCHAAMTISCGRPVYPPSCCSEVSGFSFVPDSVSVVRLKSPRV